MSRLTTSEHSWGSLISLAAPQVRNALDLQTVEELTGLFDRPGAGAVVLTGEGPQFCAGGDVRAMASASGDGDLAGLLEQGGRAFAALVAAIVTCPRPVVAAVRGAAVGGGMALALACDIRVAGRSTRLVPGWGRWGLPPDGGATALLAAALGSAAASAVLVGGQELDTASPWAPLLFAHVVEDEQVLETALAVAGRLAAYPGARAAKAVTRSLVVPALLAQQQVELAALRDAAGDPAVLAALGGVRA